MTAESARTRADQGRDLHVTAVHAATDALLCTIAASLGNNDVTLCERLALESVRTVAQQARQQAAQGALHVPTADDEQHQGQP
jgi:cyanophycinase-like exopeptidase